MRWVLFACLCLPGLARAAEPTAPPPTTAPAPAAKPDDFSFELTPPGEPKPAPSVVQSDAEKLRLRRIDERVHLRRRMLLAHQILGFATLALLAAADIIGTLDYVDKYGGGPDDDTYLNAHLGLGIVATATFTATGLVALFAPNPYPKPIKFDTALVHKASMAIAAACFLAQVILGPITSASDGKLYQRDLALAHLVIGWGAFAFMTTGTVAYMVK